jgi:ketosteroid isomerase-like protein
MEIPMRRIVTAAFALTMLAACQPAPSNDDSSQAPMSPEAAVAEVRQVFQQYVDDWNASNIEAVLAVLDDEVVQMPPNEVIVGKEALSAGWRSYLAENTVLWEPTIDELQAAGNLVFIRWNGTETTMPRADGETTITDGKGITVFRRDATGSWKLVLEQWFDAEPDA